MKYVNMNPGGELSQTMQSKFQELKSSLTEKK